MTQDTAADAASEYPGGWLKRNDPTLAQEGCAFLPRLD